MSALRHLWTLLPSAEARASKVGGSSHHNRFNSRSNSRTNTTDSSSSQPRTNGTNGTSNTDLANCSLSDLDVKALKALYDPKTSGASSPLFASYSSPAEFTVELFAQRVQALLADDRAIIERLIRFAQAHDLLKNNAERAQKLAQDSSHGLETYQKQVKSLEERNAALIIQHQPL